MFGGALASEDRHDSMTYAVTITIEETLELLGLVLLLHTLMMYAFVRRTVPALQSTPTPAWTAPLASTA